MRERYLEVFDHVWIDCLNGDKYKTGKVTPDGKPDPSIFSTDFNREGIQVGTAITLLARTSPSKGAKAVRFRHLWGKEKRDLLQADAVSGIAPKYQTVRPAMALGLPLISAKVGKDYLDWPLLPEILQHSFPGVKTSRDDVVLDIDHDRLLKRMRAYFDPEVSHEDMARLGPQGRWRVPRGSMRRRRALTYGSAGSWRRTSFVTAIARSTFGGSIGSQKRNCWTRSVRSFIPRSPSRSISLRLASANPWRALTAAM
jgi:hypothetical protein